jgi:hypothetical protein
MFRYLHDHHQAFLPIQSINARYMFRSLHDHHQALLPIQSKNARYMFRSLHDHHQAFLTIQSINARYMFRSLNDHHQAFLTIQSINARYMFRSLHDHHQAFLPIQSINARYILRPQLYLQMLYTVSLLSFRTDCAERILRAPSGGHPQKHVASLDTLCCLVLSESVERYLWFVALNEFVCESLVMDFIWSND